MPRLLGCLPCIRAQHGVGHGVELDRQVQISAPCLPLKRAKSYPPPLPCQPAVIPTVASHPNRGHTVLAKPSISESRTRRQFRPFNISRRIHAHSGSHRHPQHVEDFVARLGRITSVALATGKASLHGGLFAGLDDAMARHVDLQVTAFADARARGSI
jgi:hypothetical protein